MEQIWLIKTNQIILGPFTENEILSYLNTKTLSSLDQVLGVNEALWYPLIEHDYFKNRIGKIDGHEPTVESSLSIQTNSGITDELKVNDDYLESTTIKIEPKIRKASKTPLITLPPIAKIEPKDNKKTISIFVFFKWAIGILILLYVINWGKAQYNLYQTQRQESKLLAQGREDLKQFRYELAEQKLWQLFQTDPGLLVSTDLTALSQMMLNKGKVDLAKRVYQKIIQPTSYNEWRSWSLLGLHLKMFNQEWASALELAEELDNSIEQDMELELAKAYIQFQLKQFILADQLIEMLLARYSKVQPLVSFLVILKGQMYLEQIKKASVVFIPDKERTLSLLKQTQDDYDPYFWQKQLLYIMIQSVTKQDIMAADLVSLMEYNPFDAEYFFAPLSLWQFPFGKQMFNDLCSNLVSTIDPNHKFLMLKSIELICLYHSNQQEQLQTQIELYKKTYSGDPLLIATEALIHQHANINDKAAISPQCSKDQFWCQLANLLYCQKLGDINCISHSTQNAKVKQMGPFLILLKAQIAKRKGDEFSSRDLIIKGIQSYPNYQPLLERKL